MQYYIQNTECKQSWSEAIVFGHPVSWARGCEVRRCLCGRDAAFILVIANGNNIRFNHELEAVNFSDGAYGQFIIATSNIKAYRFCFAFCKFIQHDVLFLFYCDCINTGHKPSSSYYRAYARSKVARVRAYYLYCMWLPLLTSLQI